MSEKGHLIYTHKTIFKFKMAEQCLRTIQIVPDPLDTNQGIFIVSKLLAGELSCELFEVIAVFNGPLHA